MSDCLTREFRAQLTTTVESALRRIMFEIMNIFENSLHDHRMELAQKGEEVAQLKIKLQRSEIRLKDNKCRGDGEEDKTTAPADQVEREPETFLPASEQPFEIPEIDFEVPDDWCAPLGCETIIKQEEDVCPSVRLRQLYIPLRPVPLTKQEVDKQITPEKIHGRTRDSSPEGHAPTKSRWSLHNQTEEDQHSPVRNNTVDLRKVPVSLRGRAKGFKGTNKRSPGKEEESPLTSRREKAKYAANQSDSTESQYDAEEMYACRYCDKEFGTPFGYKVHLRTHLKCSGCKKKFPYPSVLKSHLPSCNKLKLAKIKLKSAKPSKSQPDEENRAAPTVKQEDPSLNKPSKNHGSARMRHCTDCKNQFCTQSKLNRHICLCTSETPFACRMCPKKFLSTRALKVHIQRVHKGQVDEKTDAFPWTAPLDITEGDQPRSPAPSDQLQLPIETKSESPTPPPNPPSLGSPGEKEKNLNPHGSMLLKWHTMGTRCDEGYVCMLCQKISRTKQMLIEHFCTHTGEKPLKCECCPAKFRFRSQLNKHRRKCTTMIQCDKCEKIFSSKVKYNKHVQMHHRNWVHFCKICGKGFFFEKRLQNHMKRHDQNDLCLDSSV